MADAATGLALSRPSGGPRRNVDGFRVVASGDLAGIAAEWGSLARRSVTGNVFFGPEFALPAAEHLGEGQVAVAVVASRSGELAAAGALHAHAPRTHRAGRSAVEPQIRAAGRAAGERRRPCRDPGSPDRWTGAGRFGAERHRAGRARGRAGRAGACGARRAERAPAGRSRRTRTGDAGARRHARSSRFASCSSAQGTRPPDAPARREGAGDGGERDRARPRALPLRGIPGSGDGGLEGPSAARRWPVSWPTSSLPVKRSATSRRPAKRGSNRSGLAIIRSRFW